MSSNFPRDRWRQTGGSGQQRQRQQWGDGYGRPASDSELLRQFADAYEEQVGNSPSRATTDAADVADMTRGRSGETWVPLVVGLVIFVLLLAVAMGMALLLMSHQ